MGALLSLPLLAVPGVGTLASIAASCCGAATCTTLCNSCGSCQNSVLTRIGYAILLLANSLLSWLMMTDWVVKKLEHLTMDYMKIHCVGKACYGFVAVHRLNFALGCLHLILALFLLGVNTSRDSRAPIQNGFWGPKIIAWVLLIVGTFFIPDAFFVAWGNYVALVGAVLFLFLGLVLLVDLAHSWAEWCQTKIADDEDNPRLWSFLLVGSTGGMYAASLAMTVVMYVYFASSGCSMNQAAITINFLCTIIITVLSIHPVVREYNARSGLCQAGLVAFYCTYLTMSAVGMEPDDQHCNPLVRNHGTRTASIVLGAFVTFLTMAWTTTRAAAYGISGKPISQSSGSSQYTRLDTDDNYLITAQPSSRRDIRRAALRAAIDSGALRESDGDDSDNDWDDKSGRRRDDERGATSYNYSWFHIVFLLSTAWVATLLTMNVTPGEGEQFIPVGRTYWASWVKIVSAWICYTIFSWTLVAPVLFPDRFGD